LMLLQFKIVFIAILLHNNYNDYNSIARVWLFIFIY
jgi:hypothetical protein